MKTNVPRSILSILAVLALTMGLMAAGPRGVMDGCVTSGAYEGAGFGSTSSASFHIDVTADKKVYTNAETARLTVSLLNGSPFSVYVGIGPDEPTFEPVGPGDIEPMPVAGVPIGYVLLTPLGQGPIICTQGIEPDGTVVSDCPQNRRYALPLLGSNQVLGHSTQVISALEIPLGGNPSCDSDGRPGADPGESDLCLPLEPGWYLLDCHIDGIIGVPEARAQQVIEIRS